MTAQKAKKEVVWFGETTRFQIFQKTLCHHKASFGSRGKEDCSPTLRGAAASSGGVLVSPEREDWSGRLLSQPVDSSAKLQAQVLNWRDELLHLHQLWVVTDGSRDECPLQGVWSQRRADQSGGIPGRDRPSRLAWEGLRLNLSPDKCVWRSFPKWGHMNPGSFWNTKDKWSNSQQNVHLNKASTHLLLCHSVRCHHEIRAAVDGTELLSVALLFSGGFFQENKVLEFAL